VSLDFLKRRISLLRAAEAVPQDMSFWDERIEPAAIASGPVDFKKVSHVSLSNIFGRLPKKGK
jgi:hypothetical protein